MEDTLAGKQRRIPVDMVILSAGLEPRKDAKETGQDLRHFLHRQWLVHREASEARPGGHHDRRHVHRRLCQGPKDIPATVAQGAAAAARVLGKIEQKEVALEPMRASVIEEQCSGCRICNHLCPFNAISFHEDAW